MVRRVSKAVTKTRPALQPAKRSLSSSPALAVNRAGAGDGFDEQKPVPLGIVDDDIGNLGGGIQGDAERGQTGGFEVDELVLGVADVEHHAAGSEGGAELLDDGFDERILAAG